MARGQGPDRLERLLEQARAWTADDPDPVTREELSGLVEARDEAALAERFAGFLEFGTAGLRGALGAGPHRMNRAVVIRAAAGLVGYLRAEVSAAPTVVIGYDARHGSAQFAQDTAAVVTGAGGRAVLLPRPLPTPVLSFATRHLGADAGVMVTASHNPPQDNGYKVYLGDGSQIVPPVDEAIAARIDAVRAVADVPRADEGWEVLGEEVVDSYLERAAAVVAPEAPRAVRIVHTALHGVGSDLVAAALTRAGFPAPQPVPSQADPDPDFPTVPFPNPEEPGAMDAALEVAARLRPAPDLVLANDPDADRCAVAVPEGEGWRVLRGDEVGLLLGAHLVARGGDLADPAAERRVLARSIVSSRMLGAVAEAAGLPSAETLTGFKWIGRVPGLAYGYEEALGYCVDPATVPDKDGITAALLVAELVAGLRARGRTVQDALDDLAVAHGVHQTDAFSVRVQDLAQVAPVLQRLREQSPQLLGGVPVARAEDLSEGAGGLPPTPGLRYTLADDTRVIVRPSGTEPKLKVYLEAVVAVGPDSPDGSGDRERLAGARAEATARLARTREAMAELTAL
ncbi:phospho-sugar mutase [Ornithinicoccus halotolerans]|uniref:phospho-sugar mutase n=1 Tax=Ornithinicoccus halotolerans TaxID=1748220 RepID=UPI001E59EAF4|nr:phospho-sugar mutase [Ornithinicoccus halotolerans]